MSGPSPADDGFEQIVAGRDGRVTELARAARDLVRTLDPAVVEVPWVRQAVIGFGVGPRKMTEHYAYPAVHRDQVNLGFNQGAELPDPAGLLGGPGTSLRHTRIDRLEDLDAAPLRELLVTARAHRLATTHSSGGRRP